MEAAWKQHGGKLEHRVNTQADSPRAPKRDHFHLNPHESLSIVCLKACQFEH